MFSKSQMTVYARPLNASAEKPAQTPGADDDTAIIRQILNEEDLMPAFWGKEY